MKWLLAVIWLIMAIMVLWALYQALRAERD